MRYSALLLLAACGTDVMGRRDQSHFVTACSGGVNQQIDLLKPGQCADVLNVWAPDGVVETRPGYVGISRDVSSYITATVFVARAEDTSGGTFTSPSGAGLLTLDGLVGRITSGGDQDRWYLGHSATFSGAIVVVTNTNSNATRFKAEYWNGTEWTYIKVNEVASTHLGSAAAQMQILFAAPADWATTTVDSQSAYWLRFNLLYANFDASTEIDVNVAGTGVIKDSDVRGLFIAQLPTQKRYLSVVTASTSGTVGYSNASNVEQTTDVYLVGESPELEAEPATLAVVPQFEEMFFAYGNRATWRALANGAPAAATVEDRDFAVGASAPYDPDYIAQLGDFPRAKYIAFFGGRLWAANLLGQPFAVRWSAPAPYHKVWPELAIEQLSEFDNSPITGMHPLGEHMVIFKSDSIWVAYDSGLDAFGVQTFAIRQVVAGTGCVSNSSIKAIRGNLIFLAEDGVYRFDGVGVQKASLDPETHADRLADTWQTISPGRRPFAAAAHWKTRHAYLLSFSTGGTTNATTIAWDYDKDTWWLWSNIDAQHWLEDEASNDNETLYFGDSAGRIFEFGVGKSDNGAAITSTVDARIGPFSGTARVRDVSVMAMNKSRSLTVEVRRNDEVTGTSGTLTYTDSAEADWSDFSYASGASTDDNWTAERRRNRRVAFRKDGEWFNVEITHNQKNQPLKMALLDIGYRRLGDR